MLAEKEKRGWSYRTFAAEVRKHANIRCSSAALHKLLTTDAAGQQKQSMTHFVSAICSLLGIASPYVDNPELTEPLVVPLTQREVGMLSLFRQLSPEEQDAHMALLTVRNKQR